MQKPKWRHTDPVTDMSHLVMGRGVIGWVHRNSRGDFSGYICSPDAVLPEWRELGDYSSRAKARAAVEVALGATS